MLHLTRIRRRASFLKVRSYKLVRTRICMCHHVGYNPSGIYPQDKLAFEERNYASWMKVLPVALGVGAVLDGEFGTTMQAPEAHGAAVFHPNGRLRCISIA